MNTGLVLTLALVLDAAIGEPKWFYRWIRHPVMLMSDILMTGERWLNQKSWSAKSRKLAGTLLILTVVALVAAIGIAIETAIGGLAFGNLGLALMVFTLLAARSLYAHVQAVAQALADENNLPVAREAVGLIIGRDTSELDEAAVSRAAIESLAENFSDGITAPVFWYLVGGLPGMLIYKMVNTADSMIGHRNDRHLDFGWAAARLDDLLNLVPARLTALLFAVAAVLTGRSGSALATAWHQARYHASPNAGWPEAAMAGALNIRLGGPRRYPQNVEVDGAWFGNGDEAGPLTIASAMRIAFAAWLTMVIAIAVGALL